MHLSLSLHTCLYIRMNLAVQSMRPVNVQVEIVSETIGRRDGDKRSWAAVRTVCWKWRAIADRFVHFGNLRKPRYYKAHAQAT